MDIRKKMWEEQMETLEQDMLPFGVIYDGREEVTFKEGCLSFPDITVPVKRYGKIVMSSASLQDGEYNEITLTGINAICAQHEMDHLDGITFLDKLPRQQRRSVLRKLKKK